MTITHIIFSLTVGGTETMLVDIVNNQCFDEKINLIIINDQINDTLLKKISKKVNIYKIGRKKGSKNPFSVFKLNYLLYKLRSDIIHCHNPNIISYIGLKKRKIVCTIHTTGIKYKYLYKYKRLYSISNAVKDDIYNRMRLKSSVIYNGINTENGIINIKGTINCNNPFKIVTIGRLNDLIKGQSILIKAIDILKKENFDYIFTDIIGEGESEQYLKNLVKNLDLEDRISFLGLKDREYIYQNLKNYSLLVQPSRHEGFGLTIIEGMNAKLPVLTSDIAGPMEIIANGKYGYYFQSESYYELAKQIKVVIKEDFSTLNKKVNEAYKYAINNFNIKNTALNYIKSYKEL